MDSKRKNMNDDRINSFIKDLNENISSNYPKIATIFNLEYGYPELDPLRDEICKCLICGLYQASITLTNHLLESSLKKCLAIKYSIDNKDNNSELENVFKDGIAIYDKCKLSETINKACSNGLIAKEQKKQLNKFREEYRNPYSHAESAKIFNNNSLKGRSISLIDGESSDDLLKRIFEPITTELLIKDVLPIQGIAQAMLAKEISAPYFFEVDKIIRAMLANLKVV